MELAHSKPKKNDRNWTPSDLKEGLFKVLFGIEQTWQLDQNDLAALLFRSPSTISDWKNNEKVHVSSERPDANDHRLYEFIEFYDSVSSLFFRVEDQVSWLKTTSEDFRGESPIDLLKKDPKNLYALREWVDHLARP